MTFTYEGAELSSTLKTYIRTGNEYRVVYLDGAERVYEADYKESARLDNLLLEQAIKRDNEMQISIIELKKLLLTFSFLFCNSVMALSIKRKEDIIGLLAFILTVVNLDNISDLLAKIKELKKYKIFMEIMEELKTVNNTELLKCIEIDNFYQIPLSLATLDEYTYGEVKSIQKELTRILNKKNGN